MLPTDHLPTFTLPNLISLIKVPRAVEFLSSPYLVESPDSGGRSVLCPPPYSIVEEEPVYNHLKWATCAFKAIPRGGYPHPPFFASHSWLRSFNCAGYPDILYRPLKAKAGLHPLCPPLSRCRHGTPSCFDAFPHEDGGVVYRSSYQLFIDPLLHNAPPCSSPHSPVLPASQSSTTTGLGVFWVVNIFLPFAEVRRVLV